MATLVLDVADFREKFPLFADPVKYPDSTIEMWWSVATCIVSDEDYGCLSGDCRLYAIYLLMAHIGMINDEINSGNTPGYVASATIDKVSVSRMTPQEVNSFHFWLNQTPFGQQLLALLKSFSVGGLYVGGLPERSSFRQVGGRFLA